MTTTRDGTGAPKASRHARLLRWFLALAREAHRDEEGGSMVFGAITIFLLSLLSWLIYIVGMTSSDRMQIQGAADAAAYSGALVEAESLESIAFLNDGMAFVYYAGCRYAIDATVYGTLAVLYHHDYYQYSKETSDGGGGGVSDPTGAQTNMELAGGGMSGAYLSNPGARDPQNSTDYNYFAPPPAQLGQQLALPYLWALLGGPVKQADGNNSDVDTMFTNRLNVSIQHASGLLAGETPYAKLWVSDIHSAERIILAATPYLIRRTCIDVALRNRISDDTTTCVAVSDDTDRAWTVATASNGDLAGFSDEQQNAGADKEKATVPLADRYAGQPNPVDQTTIGYPTSWFDETTGRMKVDASEDGPFNGYSQTRTCWNKRDWQHETDPTSGDPRLTEVDGQPGGHWHVRHAHQLDPLNQQTGTYHPPPVPALGGDGNHDLGHGRMGGADSQFHTTVDQTAGGTTIPSDFDWDQSENSGQDDPHMLQVCVTCEGSKAVTHTGNGAVKWFFPTFWGVSKDDAKAMVRFNFPATGGKPGVLTHAPSMLRVRGPLFRAGVTVAVWTKTASLGETLRQVAGGQDFGMLAIASAMVGPRTADTTGQSTGNIAIATQIDDSKVTFTTGGNVTSFTVGGASLKTSTTNLFLGEGEASKSNPGVRWGARLVPVARDFTWVDKSKTASQNLAAFLNGNSWYVNDPKPGDAGQGASAVAGVDFLAAMAKFYDLSKTNSADWINH